MKVLLVEDEARLAATVKEGLTSEGFVVDVVGDGLTGLWAATETSYDVIVLDIMLPGLNGYDVLKRLRHKKIWTPVLMLTAKDGEYDQTDAFELGADDYLTKPFSFVILVARLRALIRRGAPERPALISVGSLVLDPARRSVQRDSASIPLTAREYGLLLYLMRNAGDVVSKSQILENVWDSAYSGGDNVIEVYVSYLRKKIDVPFGLQTLQTLRGLGYRLDSDRPVPAARRANRDGHGVQRADADPNTTLSQPATPPGAARPAEVSPTLQPAARTGASQPRSPTVEP
jgi:DNA-binding response OmpR family regulator